MNTPQSTGSGPVRRPRAVARPDLLKKDTASPDAAAKLSPASSAKPLAEKPSPAAAPAQAPAPTPISSPTPAPNPAVRTESIRNNPQPAPAIPAVKPKAAKPASVSRAQEAPAVPTEEVRAPIRHIQTTAKKKKTGSTVAMVIRRTLLSLLLILLFAFGALYATCYTIAHGPSPTIRNMLVLSAMQASATKWVPGLFLPQDVVDDIVNASHVVTVDEIDLDEYSRQYEEETTPGGETVIRDEWENCPDGIRLEILTGSTYKAYLMLIRDPSRVSVGISGNFGTAAYGERIFAIAQKYHAVAAINGGEFPDDGTGTGATPTGLTYSHGECVWNDGAKRTFMGFDRNDRLIVSESMTKARADELGIRDAVCFQWNNVLITNEDGKVKLFYTDGDNGTAQRTAIGQRADGTVLLLVTDGRTASSLGATHNDVIDIMVSYGAVSAGMLDGGSSAMMYYENYYEKLNMDQSLLDEYQKQGLVNKYKAFTRPRRIPTYFIVSSLPVSE